MLFYKKVQVDDYLFAETLNINKNMSLSGLRLLYRCDDPRSPNTSSTSIHPIHDPD